MMLLKVLQLTSLYRTGVLFIFVHLLRDMGAFLCYSID